MRIKKALSLLLSLFILLTTTGCWDSTDVNKKVLLTLVITDKQKDDFVYYFELPNMLKGKEQSGPGGGGALYSYVTGRGKMLADARFDLDSKMDNPPFLGAIRALVLTDSMIREDFLLYMNKLESLVEYRKALRVVVTHNKPEDFLSVKLENNVSIGQSVSDTVFTLESEKMLVSYSASEIIELLYEKTCFVLPDIGCKGNNLAVIGYVVIHDGKYLKRIPLEDSMGLLFLLLDKGKWTPTIRLDNWIVETEVRLKKRKITPVYNNGKLELTVDLTFDSVMQYTNQLSQPDDALKERIRQELTDLLQTEIEKTVESSIRSGCDYLGFKNIFKIKYPEEVKQLDWCALYKDAKVQITVDTTLKRRGTIKYSPIAH